MVNKAQQNSLFTGVIEHIIPHGVAILQYADDTIICLKQEMEGAVNLKLLLYMYEMMARLKINFNKSEVIMINDEENWGQTYADLFNCQVGFFPIKYPGVPVSPSRLHVCDCIPLLDKSSKRLDIWNGGCISIVGRSTLISASLNNSPIYHMSVYLLPKTVVSKLDKIRRSSFWQGGRTKKKYHLIKWEKICKSKKKGGLGIKNLRKMNISLLCKWWWKLEREDGLWQNIVKYKYLRNDTIQSVSHKIHDSSVWYDLLKIKDVYLLGRDVCVKNGSLTRFWKDIWLYQQPLCLIAPVLFELCDCKEATVAKVRSGETLINEPDRIIWP